MLNRDHGNSSAHRGITGLETAIILIAFVVVASVFAFTVLSTGVFSAERSKETIYSGLQEARASLEPRGSIVAYRGANGASTPTNTIYKVAFIVSPSVSGQAIDLTPPYTANDTSVDPDIDTTAEYRTVISYIDENQSIADVPWTVSFIGNSNSDNLLETGEKAEITVWLLARNFDVSDIDAADATATWVADSRGASGILSTGGTLLTPNDKFTIEIKPDVGSVVTLQRTVPVKLDPVMDLR
jgi:flagellin FlaB